MSHSEATGERGLVGALRDESRVLEGARPGHSSLYAAAADALEAAQNGLLRALDYRAATPEGLAVRADVRAALAASGFEGAMGEMGSPVPSGGPAKSSDPVAAHLRARAALRQATWEATQFLRDEAVVDYVRGVLREVESDTP